MWRVEQYCNRICKVPEPKSIAAKMAAELLAGRHFKTREEAIAFMVERAERHVVLAEAELKSRKRALAALKRKYGGSQSPKQGKNDE